MSVLNVKLVSLLDKWRNWVLERLTNLSFRWPWASNRAKLGAQGCLMAKSVFSITIFYLSVINLSLGFKILVRMEKTEPQRSQDEFQDWEDGAVLCCRWFSLCRLVYHDLFRDPLNWSKTGEALPGGALGALRAMYRTHPGPVIIALDSLSWLLLHLPCTTLCQTLRTLSHQDTCSGETPASLLPLIHFHLPRNLPLSSTLLKNMSGIAKWTFFHLFNLYTSSWLLYNATYQSLFFLPSSFWIIHFIHLFLQQTLNIYSVQCQIQF